MHKTAIASQDMTSHKVPLTAARLRVGSLGRARTIRNCKAANLDKLMVIM